MAWIPRFQWYGRIGLRSAGSGCLRPNFSWLTEVPETRTQAFSNLEQQRKHSDAQITLSIRSEGALVAYEVKKWLLIILLTADRYANTGECYITCCTSNLEIHKYTTTPPAKDHLPDILTPEAHSSTALVIHNTDANPLRSPMSDYLRSDRVVFLLLFSM